MCTMIAALARDRRGPGHPARGSARGDPCFQKDTAALRAEALRQFRWQRQQWEDLPATHVPGTPCLLAATERAKFTDSLALLQEAGEDVPPQLAPRGSLVRTSDAAGGPRASVSVVGLLADIDRVLAWFEPEPSQEPGNASPHRPLASLPSVECEAW